MGDRGEVLRGPHQVVDCGFGSASPCGQDPRDVELADGVVTPVLPDEAGLVPDASTGA